MALKLLPAGLSEDDDFQRRFRREAHAAARLNSPHVIPIHHHGEIDGHLYVDMRLVEGRDLHTVLADGPLEPARAVHIIGQVAAALQAAHEVGLLHRDINPFRLANRSRTRMANVATPRNWWIRADAEPLLRAAPSVLAMPANLRVDGLLRTAVKSCARCGMVELARDARDAIR